MTDSMTHEIAAGILVVADISGYTRFSRLHFTSMLHAEQIISELMDSIIQTAVYPLQVGQLEGDAVLMYVEIPEGQEIEIGRDVLKQVRQFFAAFNLCERSLIACDAGCVCEACSEIGELRLKAVVHVGSFIQRTFQGINELIGADVTLMRALIKSPLSEREHILLTEKFYALAGGFEEDIFHAVRQLPMGSGLIPVHVYLPGIEIDSISVPGGAGPGLSMRLNQHSFGRMLLKKPRANYNNLPGDKLNLFFYLLEGLSSGFNILRKSLSRWFRPKGADMLVAPVMLILVELKSSNDINPSNADQVLRDALSIARPPLILNKMEGNAAFLYARAENDNFILAENLIRQSERMYSIYEHGLKELMPHAEDGPRFRVILHYGEVALKRVRNFDELGGLPVISIHRIMQTTNPTLSALWMTESFSQFVPGSDSEAAAYISLDGLGEESFKTRPFRNNEERSY